MKTTLDDFNFAHAIQEFLDQNLIKGRCDLYDLIDYLQTRDPNAPIGDLTPDEFLDYLTNKYNLAYSETISYTIYCLEDLVKKEVT